MKYSNELKVGTTIVVATIIFVLGVRFFQDLPLFRGTFGLTAEFDQAAGLIAGNGVRINGVSVGSVDDVFINPETQRVTVNFHVSKEISVTEGSTAQIAGFDALGVVRLDVHLGPRDAPLVPEGGSIEGVAGSDILGGISEKAPDIVDQLDLVLGNMNRVLGETGALMTEPDSDVRRTLVSVQQSAETLDEMLSSERDRLGRILGNVESFSANLDRMSAENADSLTAMVGDLRNTLARLDRGLEAIEDVSTEAADVLRKVNTGEGTLGLFVNDSSVYEKMDSVLTSLNLLLTDLKNHPDKYLKELRLVEIF